MPIEAALVKPVVDALLELFGQADNLRLQRNARAALREAIRELLQADANANRAEARIAVAKAAGILSEDVVLAEDMLRKHRASKARTRGKTSASRGRRAADSAASPPPACAPRPGPARAGRRKPPAKPRS